MGLVMQEPTLFNYTLKENILYGDQKASNDQIKKAAKVANAMEFIASNELDHAIEDNPETLYKAFVNDKKNICLELSEKEFGTIEKNLKALRDEFVKSGKRF
jgi:ABC-type phosphate transport system ATPase subunit